MKKSPFPSVFELIREFAKALDMKGDNNKVDELVKDPFAHYRNIKICIEEVYPNLQRHTSLKILLIHFNP